MSQTSPTPETPGKWVVTKFGLPSVLKWESLDIDQKLSPNEALVRIIAAGIAGVDNIQRVGGYPDPRCAKPGFTPGYEIVGEIFRLGQDSGDFKVGDRVASMCSIGGHATHLIIPTTELIRIDDSDDAVKVAALPLNYMTAWGMLKHSGVDLKPGDTILIGSVSGGVGTALAQLVTSFDLGLKMIGTCSPSKFDYVKSLGVTPVDRNADDLVAQVRSLTNGEGVKVAYDSVGSAKSLLHSYQCTQRDIGQVIAIGVMDEILPDGSGMRYPEQDLFALIGERLQPQSSFFSVTANYYLPKRDEFVKDFLAIVGKVREGKLTPEVSKLYKLKDAVETHEELISGKNVKGKMMFIVDGKLAKAKGL